MINLIISDMRRVLNSIVLYILFFSTLILMLYFKCDVGDLDYQQNYFTLIFAIAGNFVIPIYLYYKIYADDFNYGIITYDIGKGIKRSKIVIAKAIEFSVLMAVYFALSFGIYVLRLCISGVPLSYGAVGHILFILIIKQYLLTVGDMLFAGIFLFMSQNIILGLLSFVAFRIIGIVYLSSIQEMLHIPVNLISYDGLVDDGITAMTNGGFPWKLIIALVLYVGGALLITSILFDKKELDL